MQHGHRVRAQHSELRRQQRMHHRHVRHRGWLQTHSHYLQRQQPVHYRCVGHICLALRLCLTASVLLYYADTCSASSGCVFTPIVCNDNSACTNDSCAAATGCVYTTVSCNDNNACTAGKPLALHSPSLTQGS